MTTTNIGPCGCCGATRLDCEAYSVEAHWNGLTLAITPITPGDGTTAVSGSGSSGSGSSGSGSSGSNGDAEYRLGIFRKEYYGRVASCFIGSWEGSCIPVPNAANFPRAAECFYSCSCVDLDTNAPSGSGSSSSGFSDSSGLPCNDNTTSFEYILTGHFVTVYEPVEQSCDAHYRAWGCGFRGQFSVWKYTYVVVGGEASGQADVEELLYGDEYGNGEYSFIPCNAYTPPKPTVTIFF